jgi:hypothetical protein
LPLLKIFTFKGQGKIEAAKSSTDTAKRVEDAAFEMREIDTASPTGWSIEALNPARPLPHLKGAELSDAVLCTIATPNGTASVTARLEVSAQDLWLDINTGMDATQLEDDANQRAVLGVLIGKAAADNSPGAAAEGTGWQRAVVAQSVLHRRAAGEPS